MNYPIFSLEADTRSRLPAVTKVINRRDIEYFLWVHVPEQLAQEFELYEIWEQLPTKCLPVNTIGAVEREGRHPWFQIASHILNKSVGMHIYKLHLVNRYTGDVLSLYFSYILQDDIVDKPYIYMGEDRTGCACLDDKND